MTIMDRGHSFDEILDNVDYKEHFLPENRFDQREETKVDPICSANTNQPPNRKLFLENTESYHVFGSFITSLRLLMGHSELLRYIYRGTGNLPDAQLILVGYGIHLG